MKVLSVQRYPNLPQLLLLLLLLFHDGFVSSVDSVVAWPRCYGRLEHALEDMLYKSSSRSKSRALIDLSGYKTHYEFRPPPPEGVGGPQEWKRSEERASEVDDLLQHLKQQHTRPSGFYGHNKYSNVIQPSRVEVSNIKFRVPRNAKWVNE